MAEQDRVTVKSLKEKETGNTAKISTDKVVPKQKFHMKLYPVLNYFSFHSLRVQQSIVFN